MPNYAIHDGHTVVNVIVAESLEVAEAVTGMSATPVTEDGPGIGWTLVNGVSTPPEPEPAPEPPVEPEIIEDLLIDLLETP